ncbi:hypothetical protein CROQUDRAFT_91761 [Cronartium quercuum f. sp. fusiforme G11]|uniref:Uncharacterized protein n=1 Tax=Cronartium quercuum f. sp. fusiforme G11 TaxID=708437 RepID=A0A9P6NHL3_9BASI|nr:hypothetical protein CROQUDRAFT_91761 [Cronartium quercuum f. sp. fusiforme G11]
MASRSTSQMWKSSTFGARFGEGQSGQLIVPDPTDLRREVEIIDKGDGGMYSEDSKRQRFARSGRRCNWCFPYPCVFSGASGFESSLAKLFGTAGGSKKISGRSAESGAKVLQTSSKGLHDVACHSIDGLKEPGLAWLGAPAAGAVAEFQMAKLYASALMTATLFAHR